MNKIVYDGYCLWIAQLVVDFLLQVVEPWTIGYRSQLYAPYYLIIVFSISYDPIMLWWLSRGIVPSILYRFHNRTLPTLLTLDRLTDDRPLGRKLEKEFHYVSGGFLSQLLSVLLCLTKGARTLSCLVQYSRLVYRYKMRVGLSLLDFESDDLEIEIWELMCEYWE